MHCVPLAYFWQAPLPSQKPLVPQVAAVASVHWLSGSWPAGTAMQVPSEPAIAHDEQLVAQVVAQQTPCWQCAAEATHWLSAVQVAPCDSRPQLIVVVLQVFGDAQSVVARAGRLADVHSSCRTRTARRATS